MLNYLNQDNFVPGLFISSARVETGHAHNVNLWSSQYALVKGILNKACSLKCFKSFRATLHIKIRTKKGDNLCRNYRLSDSLLKCPSFYCTWREKQTWNVRNEVEIKHNTICVLTCGVRVQNVTFHVRKRTLCASKYHCVFSTPRVQNMRITL